MRVDLLWKLECSLGPLAVRQAAVSDGEERQEAGGKAAREYGMGRRRGRDGKVGNWGERA